ncbi:hypothetical protein EJ05DRAFT_487080 [Pseudovirgaria hyperparasitica]|uniref:Uncharacterized protein n=1 Tax=Pseudovirgaria hyperparasitica TaxID=470096 RepID=A0A6A6W4K3_9PEZI|nr:uncharacterized protein EJ05DRAFT_487080 [Pseudovirgaria hyperparasitica]KAF2757099.1 hypothetical protein EJ05DRAFT_487080 [Pseudovirgaria hyperparasitica]
MSRIAPCGLNVKIALGQNLWPTNFSHIPKEADNAKFQEWKRNAAQGGKSTAERKRQAIAERFGYHEPVKLAVKSGHNKHTKVMNHASLRLIFFTAEHEDLANEEFIDVFFETTNQGEVHPNSIAPNAIVGTDIAARLAIRLPDRIHDDGTTEARYIKDSNSGEAFTKTCNSLADILTGEGDPSKYIEEKVPRRRVPANRLLQVGDSTYTNDDGNLIPKVVQNKKGEGRKRDNLVLARKEEKEASKSNT